MAQSSFLENKCQLTHYSVGHSILVCMFWLTDWWETVQAEHSRERHGGCEEQAEERREQETREWQQTGIGEKCLEFWEISASS